MKSYNHLYKVALSEDVRRTSVHKVIIGRRNTPKLKRFAEQEEIKVILSYDWVRKYENAPHTPKTIKDGTMHKERKIIVPTFKELTVQHCVVQALMPMFTRGMYEHSYASIPGRGAHKGKKVIEKWIRHDSKNCKYVLKMDIRHFFDSVPHDKLKAKLAKHTHDDKMLDLVDKIIDVTEVGLPLGFYTSQWFSNWYLQGLDHYIKENLGATHYIRYMDDMVVFGSNKRKLHKMRAAIEEYLNRELGLELKGNWQVFRFAYTKGGKQYGRDLDFMGFRFYRNRTVLRRTIMLKATQKARRAGKKPKPTIYDIRQMLSYLGWFSSTDTYAVYEKWVKPYILIQKCKRRMSAYDRKHSKEVA